MVLVARIRKSFILLAGITAIHLLHNCILPRGFVQGLTEALPRSSLRLNAASPVIDAQIPNIAVAKAAAAGTAAARREVRQQMLAAAAATCRGQCGTPEARSGARQLVEALEALNPTPSPAVRTDLLDGEWRLVFASEDVTRSSPFFWGWRKMLKGIPDPNPLSKRFLGTEELSESIFAVTDGIPLKTIGEATQSIGFGKLINRVVVQVFGFGQSIMTTTSRFTQKDSEGTNLLLTVETTQAAQSSLPFFNDIVFPSETLLGENARIDVRVTYLDEDLRIFRNEADGQVFVYARSS